MYTRIERIKYKDPLVHKSRFVKLAEHSQTDMSRLILSIGKTSGLSDINYLTELPTLQLISIDSNH